MLVGRKNFAAKVAAKGFVASVQPTYFVSGILYGLECVFP